MSTNLLKKDKIKREILCVIQIYTLAKINFVEFLQKQRERQKIKTLIV